MPTVAVLPPRNQALRGGVTTESGDILKQQLQGINPVYLPLAFFMVSLWSLSPAWKLGILGVANGGQMS